MPLSLVCAAGGLVKAGYEVEIYDAMSLFATHADIEDKIRLSRPDFVGSTAFTATVNDAIAVLSTAKRVSSRIGTFLGGVHPTFMWKEILEAPGSPVDFVVRGEGEATGPELHNRLIAGKAALDVPGVAGRIARAAVAGPADRMRGFDLPPPGCLTGRSTLFGRPSISAILSSSRGCSGPAHLQPGRGNTGAPLPGLSWGELGASTAIGVSIAMLADETPTVDRDRWRRILDLLIARKTGVELMLETRADDIVRDKEWMGDMRRAGIVHIYIGVESQSQKTLDLFKKDQKVETSREAIRLINEAGIISETAFVLGMPDETPESIRKTVKAAIDYKPDMAFFMARTAWHYSDLYKDVEPYRETRDYADYNLIKAVLKPLDMTRAEVERIDKLASFT